MSLNTRKLYTDALGVINFVQGFHFPYHIVTHFQFVCNEHVLIQFWGEYFFKKVQTRHQVVCTCAEGKHSE